MITRADAARMTETDLEREISAYCDELGILRFHHPDSRRATHRGLPDDILIGPAGLLWRECKTMRGTLRPDQRRTGSRLVTLGQDWAVWRPVDLASGVILKQLTNLV